MTSQPEPIDKQESSSQGPWQRLGLAAMVNVLLGTTALIITLIFVALLTSTISLRSTISETSDSARFLLASTRAEALLVDVETGIRGAIVTGDRAQLEPYYDGIAALPVEQTKMRELAPDNLQTRVGEVNRAIDSYVNDFAQPLAARIGVLDLTDARRQTREGKARLDRIRSDFQQIGAVQQVRVEENRERSSDTADLSYLISILGLVASLALLAFIGWYLQSRVLSPISKVAVAAGQISEGRLGTRVAEVGRGAIVVLARAFNRMSAALQYRDRKLMEANRRLEGSIEEVEQASEMKSAFLANMSHEIRTPLNGVMGMNTLLEQTELSSEQREYVRTAQASGEALMAVINDILDFSKIEAGKLDIELSNFELPQAIDSACEMVSDAAHRKGLRLHSFTDPSVPSRVNGDRARFLQILVNLLMNAIKFTEEGEVIVSATPGPPVDHGQMVLIEVRDTGIGIEPEVRRQLFQAFTQADASTTRKYGGTGLGLAISAQLAELMGGHIAVDSVPGEGSTFTLYMPFGKPGKGEDQQRQPAELRGLRVLVVDPDPTSREIVERYTTGWGMRPTTTADPETGVSQLRKAAKAGQPFDVAIVEADPEIPEGSELMAQIRDTPALRATRVLLVARNRTDAASLKKEVRNMVLARPLSQSRLLDAIGDEMSGGATPRRSDETPARDTQVRDARILMAEDNEINRFFLGEVLEKRGIDYATAENGAQALAMIAEDAKGFDLVLMDCQMPELDGYEATRELRRRETSAGSGHLPVIAMTAHVMEGDREKCLAAGMDDYIGKPLDLDELDEKLGHWLGGPTSG